MPHKTPEARREYMRRYRREVQGRAPFGSEEHRARISAAITEHWKTREQKEQTGERNPRWRGEETSSNGIHTWLRRNHPKTGTCSTCGKEGKTDWAFLRHPESYTRNREDYRELCRQCHVAFDASS